MVSWRELPGPARALATAVRQAVLAAGERDASGYATAVAQVTALPAEQAGLVLGSVVRLLLEEQHPDGLDSDDIQAVLARCYRACWGWLPDGQVDARVLLAVVVSALGIHEPGVTYQEVTALPARRAGDDRAGDPSGGSVIGGGSAGPAEEIRVPSSAEYTWHAPLLIADLVAAGGRRVDRYLDAAFAEIARAQTTEYP